jgi:DNA-directed RNA polymerase specialized sigma24 family protein
METLYRRHADGLYRYALALTGDAETAWVNGAAAGISDATRSGGHEPGGQPDEARERLEFWDVFGRLPYEQREVLLLVFEYGFSQDEAAEAGTAGPRSPARKPAASDRWGQR